MPLQSLYNTSPLAEFDKLSLGAHLGMSPQMARNYLDRQTEYENLQNLYNAQVVEQYNPAEIRRMQLANEIEQYKMPTYQAQGMEAQSKMDTPGYYTAAHAADVAGFQAKKAEDKNKLAGFTAAAPYVQPTTVATSEAGLNTAQTAQDTAITTKLYQVLTDPNLIKVPKQEAIAYVQKRFPNQAQKIIPLIEKYGTKVAADMIANQLKQQVYIDPSYIKEQAKASSAGQPASVIQLAYAYAHAAGRTTPTAEDLEKASKQVMVTETRSSELKVGPDGRPILVQTSSKGPDTAKAPAAATPATPVVIPKGYKALGKAPPGTADGARTMGGKPVVVKGGIVYGE